MAETGKNGNVVIIAIKVIVTGTEQPTSSTDRFRSRLFIMVVLYR